MYFCKTFITTGIFTKMKKKGSTKGFDALLAKIERQNSFDGLSEKDFDLLQAALLIEGQREKVYNTLYYSYEKPEYEEMSPAARSWLLPFWNVEQDDNKVSLCGFVDEDGKSLSDSQRESFLCQYLHELYGSFTPFKPGTAPNEWRFFGPLWLMEKYQMKDSLNIVLEALRQDAFFMTTYVVDQADYLSALLYQLGRNQVDILGNFLYEDGLIPTGKPIVFAAIIMTALHQPQKRLTALHIATEYLKHCLDICKQGADPMNIESYALSLATAHLQNFMPQLKELYQEVSIPPIIFENGISLIEEMMQDETIPFHIEHNSLDGYLRELRREPGAKPYWLMPYGDFGFDGDEDDFDDEDYLDDDDDLDSSIYEDDDDLMFNPDDKAKRLSVRIELIDAPEPVYRDLQVPSNMYLFGFTELIALAFGWKDFDMEYEFVESNGFRYPSDEEDYALTKEFFDMDSPYYTTIDEVLNKKHKTIRYNIRKGKKDLWCHIITLQKSGKYGPNNEHQISLLDARGTYPAKSTKSLAEYIDRLKEGKIRKPNFNTVRKNIRQFEDDNSLLF